MSSIEIVKPVTVDGIEFYISKDGKERGISQVGCSRLCGVPETTMRRVINSLSVRQEEGCDGVIESTEGLEHLQGVNLYLAIRSQHQAKILDSKVVASLVSYYAFKKDLEVAKYSLQKFASIGIDTWIEKITGFNSNDTLTLLKEMNDRMGKLAADLSSLKQMEAETLGYRKATVKMPILEKWMNELSEAEAKKILAPAVELFTIKEVMEVAHPGTTFSSTIHKKLALKVGQTISSLSDKKNLKKDTPNGKGFNMKVNAYTRDQIPLIRLCLQSILSEF